MYSSAPSKSAVLLLTLAAFATVTVSSCRTQSGGTDTFIPTAPDWSDKAAWYISEPAAAPEADIFYILPTCVWDWTAEDGQLCRYSDYSRTDHIEAFLPSVELAEDIFARGQYGFYCPYYRQITLNVWMDGEAAVEELFPLSMEDVSEAFDYYLEHYNNGKPFVLAGFSQGGKAVVELVKHLPAEAYERMAAAYAIGYRISDEELAQYPQLLPATDSTGTGTIICYNSVAAPEAACGVLSPTDVCINPVNWTTDATPAVLNDSVTVTVDTVSHLLIVDGLDPEHYYAPSLASTFPLGNYHLQELTLYQEHLRRNTALRLYYFEK
ncbi:MAG TPA: DUF3089 domain-containing protein [Candidatus Coprenecus stercoravium]|uniref:DUF3089 domain-containing protein n=1 Tax=Candidatus Coprenecus stercoravium TaxID=2840735 RepID=A0A9D2GPF0_9BACT|nr:DUF3089 domain-containing protein [Candidatus Coprenecus stercoravium]